MKWCGLRGDCFTPGLSLIFVIHLFTFSSDFFRKLQSIIHFVSLWYFFLCFTSSCIDICFVCFTFIQFQSICIILPFVLLASRSLFSLILLDFHTYFQGKFNWFFYLLCLFNSSFSFLHFSSSIGLFIYFPFNLFRNVSNPFRLVSYILFPLCFLQLL